MSGIRIETPRPARDRAPEVPEGDRIFTVHQEQSVMFLNGSDDAATDDQEAPEVRFPVPHMYSA